MTNKTRMESDARPRRTCLSIPGESPKIIDKSRALPADQVMFDLEDAIAADQYCYEVGNTKRDALLRD